jgi:acetyl-CoA C-acetyltransferase
MSAVFVIAARRTAVAPRDGSLRKIGAAELGANVIRAVLEGLNLSASEVDEVIFGNALYGGGNPARVATLAAGLPESIPAITIDTQCCSGLDAILLGANCIRAGEAHVVIAGGLESYSRSPLRFHRPLSSACTPQQYDRPSFTPWPDRDPDLIDSAAALAQTYGIARTAQEEFAVKSHAKALAARFQDELTCVADLARDEFARQLDPRVCGRLPVISGDSAHGLTAATIAVQADAAAAVVLVSDKMAARLNVPCSMRLHASRRMGGAPDLPALAGIAPARALLSMVPQNDVVAIELMESFVVQAMVWQDALDLDPLKVNRGGGAVARGHPIGASGAILAVRLFHELRYEPEGGFGLAAIAAAGGLGSAALFERT